MRWWLWAILGFLIISLCCGMFVPGLNLPLLLLVNVLFGWIKFLMRVVQSMTWDLGGSITAVFCIGGLALGLHWFCRWLHQQIALSKSADPAVVRVWPWRWSLAVLGVAILMFIAGIAAVGVTHQTSWLMRSPESITTSDFRGFVGATQSINNLKDLGTSAHQYNTAYKVLPAGFSADAKGTPLHSWQTHLLPFAEQDGIFKMVDLKKRWNDTANQPAMRMTVSMYLSPLADRVTTAEGFALSHYAGNTHVLGSPESLRIPDSFKDGTSNTLLIGETAGLFTAWGQPTPGRDPGLGLNTTPRGFGNPSGRSVAFALADGSVRILIVTMSPETLRALATPAGGEKLPADWEQ